MSPSPLFRTPSVVSDRKPSQSYGSAACSCFGPPAEIWDQLWPDSRRTPNKTHRSHVSDENSEQFSVFLHSVQMLQPGDHALTVLKLLFFFTHENRLLLGRGSN